MQEAEGPVKKKPRIVKGKKTIVVPLPGSAGVVPQVILCTSDNICVLRIFVNRFCYFFVNQCAPVWTYTLVLMYSPTYLREWTCVYLYVHKIFKVIHLIVFLLMCTCVYMYELIYCNLCNLRYMYWGVYFIEFCC